MKWIVPHPVPPRNGLTLSGRPKEREIKAKTWGKKKKKTNQTKQKPPIFSSGIFRAARAPINKVSCRAAGSQFSKLGHRRSAHHPTTQGNHYRMPLCFVLLEGNKKIHRRLSLQDSVPFRSSSSSADGSRHVAQVVSA